MRLYFFSLCYFCTNTYFSQVFRVRNPGFSSTQPSNFLLLMPLENFFQAPKLVQPIFVLFSSSPHHFSSISGCIVTQFAGPLGGLPPSPVVLPPLIISPPPFLFLPRQKVVFDAPDLAPFFSAVHSLWLDGHVKLLLLPPGGKRKKPLLYGYV